MSHTNQSAKQDILILVMGATGAGKSFFINTLLGKQKMVVGRGLNSCTTEVGVGTIEVPPPPESYRLNLVDTPGFDDTFETDFEILKKIATWLQDSCKRGAKFGGVIFLHDITTPRFDGSAKRNLTMFRNLFGKDSDTLYHVVLGTTKWSLNVPGSEERHQQLETTHWKSLIGNGAQVGRFNGSHESALSLIDTIISTPEKHTLEQTVLQFQTEISRLNTHKKSKKAGRIQRLIGIIFKIQVVN